MSTTYIKKTIYATYALRVSGKGDDKGSANQLEVLRQYSHRPDVAKFLSLFDVRMMKASNREGEALRRRWQAKYGLRVLTRKGRNDFLGLSVVFGGSRFIIYASSAATMDEVSGNAFTRHICDAIDDPAFNGVADPEFLARRDRGEFAAGQHPSVMYAFDPTRFCRTVSHATTIYDHAERQCVAFEAKELHVDPAQGGHVRMIWTFVAFGSEMEATVGKARRFIGRLNKARAGYWPYREGMVPLGAQRAPVPGIKGAHVLAVDTKHIATVARLVDLGLNPTITDEHLLHILGTEYRVKSDDPKTPNTPVQDLNPGAAKRFFVRRKLEAYRDGQMSLTFVGVIENQLRAGSGHILTRRWDGLNAQGQPDRYGHVSYPLAFPKPVVTGPDGAPREGWLNGLTDTQERTAWNRLIAVRGVDDDGKRRLDGIDQTILDALTDNEQRRLTREVEQARARAQGGRPAQRAMSTICRPYRDTAAGDIGPRTFLRTQGRATRPTSGSGAYCQLRRETTAPTHPDEGISRRTGRTQALASFTERDVTFAVADLITQAVRQLTDTGRAVTKHTTTMSPALAAMAAQADPVAQHARAVLEATDDAQRALALAEGYDKTLAELRGDGLGADEPRVKSQNDHAQKAWAAYASADTALELLKRTPVDPTPAIAMPPLDGADPRDIIVGLRGVYATGPVPDTFHEGLSVILPAGVTFEPGPDTLEWRIVADVVLPTTSGETVTVHYCSVMLPSVSGRGAGGRSADRVAEMAARRMRDGQPLAAAAHAATHTDLANARRVITAYLRNTQRFTNDGLIQTALDCPITETTRALWEHATATAATTRSAFDQHIVNVYTGVQLDTGRTTTRPVWAYALSVDSRFDQLIIAQHATDPARGILAGAMASLIGANSAIRRVLDASATTIKVNGTYPPSLRRMPTTGYPGGWHGPDTNRLSPERKWVGLTQCPYKDCTEQYATVLCPALEVLALGAMMMCRRCLRAATPPGHPMHAQARTIRFPHAYIDWFDTQDHRSGHVARCTTPECTRDVGFGPGRTWQWQDDPESRAWHDDDCRTGTMASRFTHCAYQDCDIEEGGGPGQINHERYGRRKWHNRTCEFAEERRQRSATVRYVTCAATECQIDEGAGPGSIRTTNRKLRTVHTAACRRAARPESKSTTVRRWARAHGLTVPDHGRLPNTLLQAYRTANPEVQPG